MLIDLPAKILNALASNLTLYFMTNLRRTPGTSLHLDEDCDSVSS